MAFIVQALREIEVQINTLAIPVSFSFPEYSKPRMKPLAWNDSEFIF